MKHIPWFLVFVMSPFILMFDINRKLETFGGSFLSLVILLVSFWYHDLQPMETYELTCHIFKLCLLWILCYFSNNQLGVPLIKE